MGGSTGNIRTLRNQSGTNGYRTLGSILSSDSGAGAGSARRIYGWYKKNDPNLVNFYSNVFGINYGQYSNNQYLFR
jgi:hypothetical protein